MTIRKTITNTLEITNMKLAKYIAAAAISAAFALPATAGTIGMADLAINGLAIITGSTTAPIPVTSGFDIITDNRTGTASSDFNGTVAVGEGPGNITRLGGLPVDVKYRCAGPDCGSIAASYGGMIENNTTTHISAPNGNYALGDMFINGSALDGGANGMTRANASVANPTNTAGANATIANSATATTEFTVAETLDVAIALTYDAFVAALTDVVDPNVSAESFGTISWNLTLRSQALDSAGNATGPTTLVFTWAPEALNQGLTASAVGEGGTYSSNATIFSDFVTLNTNTKYFLTINQASNALAAEVPEPGSMILVGLGLAALGAAARRRRTVK